MAAKSLGATEAAAFISRQVIPAPGFDDQVDLVASIPVVVDVGLRL